MNMLEQNMNNQQQKIIEHGEKLDIQKIASKILNTVGLKTHPQLYPGEAHLIDGINKPYHYAGPNTNIFYESKSRPGRLDPNTLAPKPGSEPINYLDEQCR